MLWRINRRIYILFTWITGKCFCSLSSSESWTVTRLQVPTTHSEEINLTAKKGSWTANRLAHKMISVDETGEPFYRIQTVPSVCLSVSLSGNRPPTYTKEVFCLVRRVAQHSCSVRISTGLNSQERKMVNLLFTKSSGTCCSCQGRVWTLWWLLRNYVGQIPHWSVLVWICLIRGRKTFKQRSMPESLWHWWLKARIRK